MSFEKLESKDDNQKQQENQGNGGLQSAGRRNFVGNIFKGAAVIGAVGIVNKVEEGLALGKKVGNIYQNRVEEVNGKNNPVDKKKEMKDSEIQNIADHYLNAFKKLSNDNNKFPDDVFDTDLLIAQQCQESRGKIDARSHSNAKGVMQNLPSSIVDVTAYLNKLARNTGFDWGGPKSLTYKDKDRIKEIEDFLIKKSDYGRAVGKIYLMMLWDHTYGYGVGEEKYEKGDKKAAQEQILGAYNAGVGRIKDKDKDRDMGVGEWEILRDKYKNEIDKFEKDRHRKIFGKKELAIHKHNEREYRAYNEAITYVERIFSYKERIGYLKSLIHGHDGKGEHAKKVVFDGNEDYAVRQMILKFDGKGIIEKSKLATEATPYLNEFREINLKHGRGPLDKEIDKILSA
jgi:hypothetical protein